MKPSPAYPILPSPPAALLLLASVLLTACAARPGVGPSTRDLTLSGSGAAVPFQSGEMFSELPLSSSPLQREPDAEVLERARMKEAWHVMEAAWAAVKTTDSPGAEWELRFWSHDGALTLLSFRRSEEGNGRTAPVSRGAFLQRFERRLPALLGPQPREVSLTLERNETGWSANLDKSSRNAPPTYARTLPSARGGASQEKYQQALSLARDVARLMTVPRGGSSRLQVLVTIEDERLIGWEPGDLHSSGNGPALVAPEEAVTTLLGILLPFTRGLGERTVALTLQGEHRHGEAQPRWSVVDARTLEPPPPPVQVADFHQEYRALHERIIFDFQEQSSEHAIQAAAFTLEQAAYTVVGGLLLKGVVATLRATAPTIASMLAQGGRDTVRWFRTLLVRAGPEEQALLRQLWLKAETRGFGSLSAAEKQQFHALMGRLEKVLGKPLDTDTKRELWRAARQDYFKLHYPEFAKLLGNNGISAYQVHHLIPMEYAHLFRRLDINSKANLAGVHRNVHHSISKVWASIFGANGSR